MRDSGKVNDEGTTPHPTSSTRGSDYNIILCTDLYTKRPVATGRNRSLPGSLLFKILCNWQPDRSTTGAAEAATQTGPRLGPVRLPVFFRSMQLDFQTLLVISHLTKQTRI
jgi:hypothetical protein